MPLTSFSDSPKASPRTRKALEACIEDVVYDRDIEWLTALLEASGLSQSELAEITGCHQQTVSKLLRRRRRMGSLRYQIADTLLKYVSTLVKTP